MMDKCGSVRDPGVISIGPDRYAEALEVLHAGFGSVRELFGITVENDPHYPAFWSLGDVARAVGRPSWLLGIVRESTLAGCAFAGPSRHRVGCWELRHLAVVPAHGQRGLGEALVRAAAALAGQDGADVLRIGIVAENRRLAGWYHRLGFDTVSSGEEIPPLPFTIDRLELRLSR